MYLINHTKNNNNHPINFPNHIIKSPMNKNTLPIAIILSNISKIPPPFIRPSNSIVMNCDFAFSNTYLIVLFGSVSFPLTKNI